MIRSASYSVPTTATTVADLLGSFRWVSAVIIQSPETNSNTIYFGDENTAMFLPVGQSISIPTHSTKNVYIKGTSGDTVTIGIC